MEIKPTCPERPLRVVAIGDSLTAGTQDSTTVEVRQEQSYMAQLSRDVGFPFRLADISESGISPRRFVDGEFNYGRYGQTAQAIAKATLPLQAQLAAGHIPENLNPIWNIPGMGHRTPDSIHTPRRPQDDFAVPGYEIRHLEGIHRVRDWLEEMKDGVSRSGLAGEVPLIRNILQNGTDLSRGSALDQAIRRRPDLTVVWAGNNDALEAVGAGYVDDRVLTPLEDRPWTYLEKDPKSGQWVQKTTPFSMPGFKSSLQGILSRLLQETQSAVLMMTIPDVTVIPTLRSLGQPVGPLPFRVTLPNGTDVTKVIESWILPTAVKGAGKDGRTDFPAGSKVTLGTILSKFVEQGKIESEADLHRCMKTFAEKPLFEENDVMDPDELGAVSTRVQEYNQAIREAASDPRVHLLDINAELDKIHRDGRPLRGQGAPVTATTTFTGTKDARGFEGIFSYDGVHPSDTGHALVANLILDKLQAELGGNLRFHQFLEASPIDELAVLARDPHHTGHAAVVLGAS